jgi:hypothetical protein
MQKMELTEQIEMEIVKEEKQLDLKNLFIKMPRNRRIMYQTCEELV